MPFYKLNNVPTVDPETYLHRIGRTGRFDTKGVAVNLIDISREDMKYLNKIIDHY